VTEIEAKALNRQLLEQFKAYIKVTQQISEDKLVQVLEIQDPHHLTYAIANEIPINLKEKQELLEIDDIFERNKQLLIKISNKQEVAKIEREIGKHVQTSMEKTETKIFLHEHIKAVQEELDDSEGNKSEIDQLKEKIEDANMPENA